MGGEHVALQATTYYNVPRLDVLNHVERKKLSTRLEELLSNGGTPCQRIVGLLGMGGTGKTQLALRFCRRMKQNGRFRGIFWVSQCTRKLHASVLSGQQLSDPNESVSFIEKPRLCDRSWV